MSACKRMKKPEWFPDSRLGLPEYDSDGFVRFGYDGEQESDDMKRGIKEEAGNQKEKV